MTQQRPVYWSSDELRHRLRRVEGQIRGIEAMVDRTDECRNILVQLAATQGALAKIVKIVEACQVAEELVSSQELTPEQQREVQESIRRVMR